MGKTDLIKTVRGLDQSGPGERGENLEHLWKSITESSDLQFHAAEESSLRWLLKSMNGSTPAAETLRRYPLTWRLLGCVFQRIPLFSLAKSLADRRFITILQQTIKEISTKTQESGSSQSSKRKRSPATDFSLDSLKSLDGRIESAQAIFEALGRILSRMDYGSLTSAHDKIGAEHLKSLFGISTKEAATVTAQLVRMCSLILHSDQPEKFEGCESWVSTVESIWGLHLQDDDGATAIATDVFSQVAVLMAHVEGLSRQQESEVPKAIKIRWSTDLRRFLHSALILPTRSAFINHRNDKALILAMETATEYADAAGPVLYLLAATATEKMAERGVRKGNTEWMKRVFQIVFASVNSRKDDRAAIMKSVLRQARERSMPVATEDLRSVYRQCASEDESTNWELLANLAQCDPDMFQGGKDGTDILNDVCSRILSDRSIEKEFAAVLDVIGAIAQGFRSARDFSSFLKLWFEQLAKIQNQKLKRSPWLSVGRDAGSSIFDCAWVEQELSTKQLLDLLDWVESQEVESDALSLWLNAVSSGIRSDDVKDAIGQKLFDLSLKITKSKSQITALKWRTVSKAFTWSSLGSRTDTWAAIKDPLAKILKKGAISSPETYEAFKCCCRVWVSMTPDGPHVDEAAKTVEDFSTRLAAEVTASGIVDDIKLPTSLQSESEAELQEESAIQQYLAWYLRGSTRLNRLYFEKKQKLLPSVHNAISNEKARPQGLEAVWGSLLDNEHCINETKLAEDLLDRVITALAESKKDKQLPQDMSMRLLSTVSLDAIARPQRERATSALVGICTSSKRAKKLSKKEWNLALSLVSKLMTRPTFYEGMAFEHLVDISSALSKAFTADEEKSALGDLIGRYSLMTSTIVKQMTDNIDERSASYLVDVSAFIAQCQGAAEGDKAEEMSPLHMTLLKTLKSDLSQSTNLRSHAKLASLPTDAGEALGSHIASVFSDWVADKKMFSKPSAAADLRFLAAVDAAESLGDIPNLDSHKSSALQKLEKRSLEAMEAGEVTGWKMQIFLQRNVSQELEVPRPATFHNLGSNHDRSREVLLREYVAAITKAMGPDVMMMYLEALIGEYNTGCPTDGQLIAIHYVVDQLIGLTDFSGKADGFDLSGVHSEMTRALVTTKMTTNAVHISRILHILLERKPQAMGQWNIESLLEAVATVSSEKDKVGPIVPFAWLCKLVEVIIKKHRLRLEGHYHILLVALQSLLRNLILDQRDGISVESKAGAYSRLITLVCEPTAGAVSRSQHHSALDSATDAAKRSAGRHMYLVLMQYVKLQLETDISRPVREALEPAMNTIFDITPPEGRKLLNDAMDASGRAILREVFKRYTKFGKWSGV